MQKIMRSIFFLVIFLAIKTILAQDPVTGSDHGDHHHDHNHSGNELGLANSLIYLINEGDFAYGLHLHYIRHIKHSRFGLGVGYERIFDEHKHNTIGPIISFVPIDRWSFSFSPGIMFEDEHLNERRLALHLETYYEFELGRICIGPAIEFAYAAHDLHLSFGLHLGFTF